jgi:hypothetical protein
MSIRDCRAMAHNWSMRASTTAKRNCGGPIGPDWRSAARC